MRALALVAIMVTASAHADPDAAALERAKVHFKQARALQNAGDYARAADEYKAAYELDARPEFLFDIGQAFRLAGAKREALDYFRRYLEQQPDGPGADEARKHVAILTEQTDEGLAHKPEPPVDDTTKPPIVAPQRPKQRPVDRIDIAIAPPDDRSRTLRIAGLATGGVGVVALAVGVALGVVARNDAAQLTGHTGAWTQADHDAYYNGLADNRNMGIAYTVGGVLAATGGVLYWLGARHVRAAAFATPHGAGGAITGEF